MTRRGTARSVISSAAVVALGLAACGTDPSADHNGEALSSITPEQAEEALLVGEDLPEGWGLTPDGGDAEPPNTGEDFLLGLEECGLDAAEIPTLTEVAEAGRAFSEGTVAATVHQSVVGYEQEAEPLVEAFAQATAECPDFLFDSGDDQGGTTMEFESGAPLDIGEFGDATHAFRQHGVTDTVGEPMEFVTDLVAISDGTVFLSLLVFSPYEPLADEDLDYFVTTAVDKLRSVAD